VGLELATSDADPKDMALRIATRLPRLLIVGAVLLLASATLAVGAAKKLAAVPKGAPAPVAAPTMVVPDIAGQAFVFAKGSLEDTGFAWRVIGSVHGFAANKVATQSPAAGTRIKDTGAPTITVTLARTPYPEKGEPEDVSPYIGTSIQPVGVRAPNSSAPLPAAPRGAAKKAPVPAKNAPARTTTAPKVAAPTKRAPAFVVPNVPDEPLDEMSLPQRAHLLSAWINAHPKPTTARVRHFLYQHAWIVTGAKFGWWHGAEALRELIAADRAAQKLWGIGRRSELAARKALAEVEKRVK
jgi:PASTA domain-containing protein